MLRNFLFPLVFFASSAWSARTYAATEFLVVHTFELSMTTPGAGGKLEILSGGKFYGFVGQTIYSLPADGSSVPVALSTLPTTQGALFSGLIEPAPGILFGAARSGGPGQSGSLFTVDVASGAVTVVRAPAYPALYNLQSPPLAASDGKIYVTASDGGPRSYGGIFRINLDGSGYQILHDNGISDGRFSCGLVEGADGALYGAISTGGNYGQGTIFRMEKDGSGFVTLHHLNVVDGYQIEGELIQGSDGWLYGAASYGGDYNSGTLFRVKPDGSIFQKVHDFSREGGIPNKVPLLEAGDGKIYGTISGFLFTQGSIFRMNRDGSGYEILHDFVVSEGIYPSSKLAEVEPGVFYGTTGVGGQANVGTLFRLKVTENSTPRPPVVAPSKPFLRVSKPLKKLSVSEKRTISISGTASDAEGISRVEYRLNGAGPWVSVPEGNGRWSTKVRLLGPRGWFYLAFRAQDASGNYSKIIFRTVHVVD